MSEELAPCPCGQIPEKLIVDDSGHARCALVAGYCCGEWAIGFRTNRSKFDSEENIRRARVAWNAAPRGNGNELLVDDLASLLRRLASSRTAVLGRRPGGRSGQMLCGAEPR